MKSRIIDISLTVVVMIGLSVVTAIIYLSSLVLKHKDELMFTIAHPVLIAAMKQQYASKSAELEKSFVKSEKTPEQKLVEAVADSVSLGK